MSSKTPAHYILGCAFKRQRFSLALMPGVGCAGLLVLPAGRQGDRARPRGSTARGAGAVLSPMALNRCHQWSISLTLLWCDCYLASPLCVQVVLSDPSGRWMETPTVQETWSPCDDSSVWILTLCGMLQVWRRWNFWKEEDWVSFGHS